MNLDSLGNVADIVAVPIALTGVYLVVRQLYLSRVESENEHLRRKKEITLSSYNEFREDIRDSYNRIEDKLHIENYEVLNENHIQQIKLNSELKNDVTKLLSFMERFAIGVQHDIFDIKFIDDLSGRVFIETFKQFKPYINETRKISRKYYTGYEKLVKELEIIRQ